MLPDVGGTELVLIAAVALIVVGPKDLPMLMRKVGQFVGRMRAMAGEFRASFDDMARQSELDDLRKEIDAMRGERLDPVEWAGDAFKGDDEAWHDRETDLAVAPPVEAAKPKRARKAVAAAKAPKATVKPAAKRASTSLAKPRKPRPPATPKAAP